ncbi:hypothetical protein Vi05172_g3615 [Venturia inaequalis]|nr:hypothetical protein Vi05172_g3615 [Venturia inaequalis]
MAIIISSRISRTSSILRTSTKAKTSKTTRKPNAKTGSTSLEMTRSLIMLEGVFVTGLPLRRGPALSTVLRRTSKKMRVSKLTRKPKTKLLPTMIAPLKTLMASMTPPPPSPIVALAPDGLGLLAILNTLPHKEVEVFWNAVSISGRSLPMLFRPMQSLRFSLSTSMFAPTLTNTVLTKLRTPIPPKPKPTTKPRTTFFSLPAELRQKILIGMFETHKLHYVLQSPTTDVDFVPSLLKHSKKCARVVKAVVEVCKKLGAYTVLWDDLRYVQKFWQDEMNGLADQSLRVTGMADRKEDDYDYDSDQSDEEEGRVYFDCVEGRVVGGEE